MEFTRYFKDRRSAYRITCRMRFEAGGEFNITGVVDKGVLSGGAFTKTREDSCGCIHDEIAKHFPEFKHLIKWHLMGVKGPAHYVGNTLYHASDRDYNGLRKGEVGQLRNGKTGELCWKPKAFDTQGDEISLHALDNKLFEGDQPPDDVWTVGWVPWSRVGEGKERNLDAARRSAVWLDATDDELMADDLKEKLAARLPALMAAFKADMLSVGFVWPEGV